MNADNYLIVTAADTSKKCVTVCSAHNKNFDAL